jgi:cyclopropane fatty-acyl-phospholipid synthase-like methyltransferase
MTHDHAGEASKVARLYNFLARFGEEAEGGEYLHVGLFNGPGDNLPDAKHRLTETAAARLHAQAGHHILDLGCGVGMPAVQVSRHYRCQITGVTIASDQAASARALIAEEDCTGRARVLVGDAHQLPFAADSFDGAMALESLLHMDRLRALGELARLVRRGGRLVLTDWFEMQALGADERKALRRSFCMNAVTLDHYRSLLGQAGFRSVEVLDISAAIGPTYDHWAEFRGTPEPRTPTQFVTRYNAIASAVLPILRAKLGYAIISATRA